MSWKTILMAGLAWAVSACAGLSTPTTDAAPQARGAGNTMSARLRALMAASDEAGLDRQPLNGLFRGDLRRAGDFGDELSDRYVQAQRSAADQELAQLDHIDREALDTHERISHDAFRWNRQDAALNHAPAFAAIWTHLPLNQYNGLQLLMATLSAGESVAPYRTVLDYEQGLSRIEGYIAYLELAMVRLREGMALGIVHPRVIVERMLAQFEEFAAQGLSDTPFYKPVTRLPAEFSAAERERLQGAYRRVIETRLQPTLREVHRFLRDDYLPAARPGVGLSDLPGGAAYYDALVHSRTTTHLTAAQVHELGLQETERITAEMRKVLVQLNYPGSLQAFFEHLRDDPQFKPASGETLLSGFARIERQVDAAMPRLFKQRPRTALEVRPMNEIEAPSGPAAYYLPGSLDTGTPGVFYVNTYDLPSRNLTGMETLFLHEAIPGHHHQISLAAENLALPKLQRFEGNTAYIEGWALYAESLGPELGLYTDPHQLFGRLNDEILRALRLVVDTGLHVRGWSRERAIDYMLAHSALSRVDVSAEVERYIVDPGQALAYKVGELTLRRLRTQCEQTLGARFDIRAFHDQVLDSGSLPLDVLDAKISAWAGTR
jgi:uncharacterized protein (DUF885 family)